MYNKVGHGDFVVDWPAAAPPDWDPDDYGEMAPSSGSMRGGGSVSGGGSGTGSDERGSGGGASANSGGGGLRDAADALARHGGLLRSLPPYCADLARIVTGAVAVDYVTARPPGDGAPGARGRGAAAAAVGPGSVAAPQSAAPAQAEM